MQPWQSVSETIPDNENVGGRDDLGEEACSGLADLLAEDCAVFLQRVHDHGVLEAEGVAQVGRGRDIDVSRVRDLDTDQTATPGKVDSRATLNRLRSRSLAIWTLDIPSMKYRLATEEVRTSWAGPS